MARTDVVDMEKHGWLLNTPATDGNFKRALEGANMATLRFALQNVNGATKRKAIEARIKQLERQGIDPDSEAALEVVEVEQLRERSAQEQQQDREARIAQTHEVIGRIQGLTFIQKVTTVGTLVQLKQIKESKSYRDLPNVGTWENFCNYIGLSRQKVDEDLVNLASFGEEFLTTVSTFSLGYRELRKLRQLTADGTLVIDEAEVVIGGERIPFDPSHKDDLQAALEQVLEANARMLADKDSTIKAKDKVLKSKQELIERQAKELGKFEDQAFGNGHTVDEEAFILRCNNARISIDGFLIQFDPERNPLPDDATPRMQAALMETLGYFKRILAATYDTAAELYGDAEIDGSGWTPPHLRDLEESLAAARTGKGE